MSHADSPGPPAAQQPHTPTTRRVVLALALLSALAVFLAQLLSPPGFAVSVLYLVIVLACSRQPARETLVVAIACTALVAAGTVMRPPPPGVPITVHLLSRLLVVAAIWI